MDSSNAFRFVRTTRPCSGNIVPNINDGPCPKEACPDLSKRHHRVFIGIRLAPRAVNH